MAYIGPGAGIAAAGSVMVLLGTFLLAFGIVLIYPIKVVARAISSIGKAKAAQAETNPDVQVNGGWNGSSDS